MTIVPLLAGYRTRLIGLLFLFIMEKNNFLPKIILFFLALSLMFVSVEIISKKIEKKLLFKTNNHKIYLQRAKPKLHRISPVPGLSYELVPNAESDNGFYVVNSQGIRDNEFKIPKPADVYRIIIVGDSVTFATEYSIEKTYPKILEKLLNENHPLKKKFEVLNGGVCGYNALQKYIFLKEKLLKYDPDLVIFQYLNDDYSCNAVIMRGVKNDYEGLHINMSIGEYFADNFPQIIPLPKKIDRFLMRYCSSYRLINKKIYDKLSQKNPEFYLPYAYKYAGGYDNENMRKLNQQIFAKLKTLSVEFDFDTILLLVSYLDDDFKLDDWIRDYCPKKYDFKTINLLERIKAKGIKLSTLRVVPEGDCHLNAFGHRLTAAIIAQYLNEYLSINQL